MLLRALCYYRPKEQENLYRKARVSGHTGEGPEDIISVRHKQLIRERARKHQSFFEHIGMFTYKELREGWLRDLVIDWDARQGDKLRAGLHDVVEAYIRLFENVEVRLLHMLNF